MLCTLEKGATRIVTVLSTDPSIVFRAYTIAILFVPLGVSVNAMRIHSSLLGQAWPSSQSRYLRTECCLCPVFLSVVFSSECSPGAGGNS